MRGKLQFASLLVILAVLGVWLSGGRNLGWTKNSVPHKVKDPVTELEVDVYDKKFVPGVDFLAAGFGAAGLVAGISFLFPRRSNPQT